MGFRLLIQLLDWGLTTESHGLLAAALALSPKMRILFGTMGPEIAIVSRKKFSLQKADLYCYTETIKIELMSLEN